MRIARDRFLEEPQGALAILARIARAAPAKQIARAEKQIVGVEIARRMDLQAGFFARRKIGAQGERDPARQLGLEREEIGDLAIVGVVPNVEIGAGVDQLGIDPHPVRLAPHGPFHHVGDAERFADLAQVPRPASVLAHGSAADHFQVRHLRQARKDVVLDAVGEIGVLLVVAEIFERQHRDAFSGGGGTGAFAIVTGVGAFASSMSSVRLMPLGVRSNAQERRSATGKPSTSATMTSRTTHVGISKKGKTWVAIWISSQLRTA